VAFIAVACNTRNVIYGQVVAIITIGFCTIVFIAGVAFFATQCCMDANKLEIRMRLVTGVALIYCHYTRLA
jgi:hypothetical protein